MYLNHNFIKLKMDWSFLWHQVVRLNFFKWFKFNRLTFIDSTHWIIYLKRIPTKFGLVIPKFGLVMKSVQNFEYEWPLEATRYIVLPVLFRYYLWYLWSRVNLSGPRGIKVYWVNPLGFFKNTETIKFLIEVSVDTI